MNLLKKKNRGWGSPTPQDGELETLFRSLLDALSVGLTGDCFPRRSLFLRRKQASERGRVVHHETITHKPMPKKKT
jgi:hypothetical protein